MNVTMDSEQCYKSEERPGDGQFKAANMEERQKQALGLLKEIRVWSKTSNDIVDQMENCRILSKYGGEPRCMLVTGHTGAGKSELIAKYRKDHQHYEKLNSSVKPVIYSELPTQLCERGLLINVIKTIGPEIEDFACMDNEDLIREIVRLVNLLGIEAFILDEAQKFLEHESRRLQYDATDCVKNLIIRTKRPFILFGMPWCLHAIEQNPQLASRFLRRYHLKPFKIMEPNDRSIYCTFLDMLDEKFIEKAVFTEKSDLKSQDTALRLFAVSRGNLRVLRNTIDEAATYAIIKNAPRITYGDLSMACDSLFPDGNPFRVADLNDVIVQELAKPSYWDPDTKRSESPVKDETFTNGLRLGEVLSAS
ncbi:TniB family NTP-binding protein [Endozoicomonas acroporae]|uniref:TniB family NTP-binding protein n=1 Tax=Endozoicomonas acroporae TaxID=1701104 RepID=UPI003D78F8E8